MYKLINKVIDDTGLNPTKLSDELGVSRSSIYAWKNGEKVMSVENFVNLSKIVLDSGNMSHAKYIELILKAKI